MVSIGELWQAVLVAAVLVFVVSSALHMLPTWHKNDYPKLANEDAVLAALRPLQLPPGDYMVPRASSGADAKNPAFVEKFTKGPVVVLTVAKRAQAGMGKNLVQWFAFTVVVGLFVAYVAGRALGPEASYLRVHQIAGAVAFGCYAFASWPMSIWYYRSWGNAAKETADALIYSMLTGGAFGWLWP